MSIEVSELPAAVAVGIGATLVMDLWSVFLKHAFNIPTPNYCLVGRWLRHIPEGTFRHKSISAASPKPAECAVGWIAHYAIGIFFALMLVQLTPASWLEQPTLPPAVILGLGTVVLPFFVLQPSFGLGAASSKAPNPTQARLRSLMNHTIFGIGLYIAALAVRLAF